MHLLELLYIQVIRLFQRYKTMNANTITASNGPITKYHCLVALAEKKKKKQNQINQKKNKKKTKIERYLVTLGQLKTKDASKTRLFSFEIIFCILLKAVLSTKNNNPFETEDLCDYSCTCCTLLYCTTGPSLSIHFLLIVLIVDQSLCSVRIMTVSFLTTELIPCTQAMCINSVFDL